MEFQPSYEGVWEAAYVQGPTPFDLEEPLPWVVTLAEEGRIRGRVLDAGCGGGHNALYLARLGYDVVGIDVAPSAISRARHKARQQGVHVEFAVGDLVSLSNWPSTFDTVIDIGCFHSLHPEDRARYAAALHAACHREALLHMRCFTDRKQEGAKALGIAARLSASDLERSFADGWEIKDLIAAADHAIPAPRSWSRSSATGEPEGVLEHEESRQAPWAGSGSVAAPQRVSNPRPNHRDPALATKRNTDLFWYVTVARRP